MERSFSEALKQRRTYYSITNQSPISDQEIECIVNMTVRHVPSAFNSQSTRVVLLLGESHKKFYVVWEGVTPGVYTSWTDCQLQIKGYEAAKYKSFDTREEAERALTMSPYAYIGKNAKAKSGGPKPSSDTLPPCVIDNSLAVDAACSGNPGPMEYRGVHIASRQEI